MKLKILYLTQHAEIGGGETILLSLLEKLDRNRFSPHVVVPKQGTLTKELESRKVPASVLSLPGYLIRTLFIPGMSPFGIFRFMKLVKKIKPDLIHLNHLNLAVYAGIAGRLGIHSISTRMLSLISALTCYFPTRNTLQKNSCAETSSQVTKSASSPSALIPKNSNPDRKKRQKNDLV